MVLFFLVFKGVSLIWVIVIVFSACCQPPSFSILQCIVHTKNCQFPISTNETTHTSVTCLFQWGSLGLDSYQVSIETVMVDLATRWFEMHAKKTTLGPANWKLFGLFGVCWEVEKHFGPFIGFVVFFGESKESMFKTCFQSTITVTLDVGVGCVTPCLGAATELLNTPDDMLEFNARRLKHLCSEELAFVSEHGRFNFRWSDRGSMLFSIVSSMADGLLGDTQLAESINSCIKLPYRPGKAIWLVSGKSTFF